MTRNKSSAAHTARMAYVTVLKRVPGTYLESVPLDRFDPLPRLNYPRL